MALPKPKGGVRTIALQDSPCKLPELVLVRLLAGPLAAAAGDFQFGAEVPGGGALALECLRAAAAAADTCEMLSVDIANAYGTLRRDVVMQAIAERAPQVLPYITAAWPA